MEKPADTPHDLHPLLRGRWSPRAFSTEPITREELASLLEAARWAPSCFNEQPWRFIVALREEAHFAALLSCLAEKNQAWAKDSAALVLSVAKTTFSHNDKPNRHAAHDVGLATMQLVLQGEALGIRAHQMAGFSAERAREVFAIPEGFEPLTAIALGNPGSPDTLPADLAERERTPRTRKDAPELFFGGSFGDAWSR